MQMAPDSRSVLSVLRVGGNANNGANDGPFYGNWNNTASNSNWNYAARPTLLILTLMKHQRLQDPAPAGYGESHPYPLVKITAARTETPGSGTRRSRFILEPPCRQERGY